MVRLVISNNRIVILVPYQLDNTLLKSQGQNLNKFEGARRSSQFNSEFLTSIREVSHPEIVIVNGTAQYLSVNVNQFHKSVFEYNSVAGLGRYGTLTSPEIWGSN